MNNQEHIDIQSAAILNGPSLAHPSICHTFVLKAKKYTENEKWCKLSTGPKLKICKFSVQMM